MPGCLPLIAAILMQKFPGSVKLTSPEKQSLIRRRLENWKHEDLAYQGYTYSLESNQNGIGQVELVVEDSANVSQGRTNVNIQSTPVEWAVRKGVGAYLRCKA